MKLRILLPLFLGLVYAVVTPAGDVPAFTYDPSKASIYLEQTLPCPATGLASQIRQELSATVEEILDGPWQPLSSDYSGAEAGGVGPAEWCFQRPGETLLALSMAAPAMTPGQKAKARKQLSEIVKTNSPTRHFALSAKEAKSRNFRKVPPLPSFSQNAADTQRALFPEAYSLWAYAYAFDAWDEVKPLFSDLQKLREQLAARGDFSASYKPEAARLLSPALLKDSEYCFKVYESLLGGFHDNYGYHGAREARQRMDKNKPVFFYVKNLTGLIGYYRLARHWGLDQEADWARQTFNQVAASTLQEKSAPFLWSDPSLCPEVGRLLRDAAGSWLDKLARTPNVGNLPARDWDNRVVPERRDHYVINPFTWYHAWGGQGEGVRPRTVLGTFLVNAWLFSAGPDPIARTLDVPWCKADLYYAVKLVTAIQALEKPGWIPVR